MIIEDLDFRNVEIKYCEKISAPLLNLSCDSFSIEIILVKKKKFFQNNSPYRAFLQIGKRKISSKSHDITSTKATTCISTEQIGNRHRSTSSSKCSSLSSRSSHSSRSSSSSGSNRSHNSISSISDGSLVDSKLQQTSQPLSNVNKPADPNAKHTTPEALGNQLQSNHLI